MAAQRALSHPFQRRAFDDAWRGGTGHGGVKGDAGAGDVRLQAAADEGRGVPRLPFALQRGAQRLFAEMLSDTEAQNKALADAWLETAIEYKVSWERELHRRGMMGIKHLPPPLPHPDQVKIDMNTGAAWVQGPATKEQVEQLELWIKRRDDWQEELDSQLELLTTETDLAIRKFIEDDIVHSRKILAMIDVALKKIG